MNIDNLINLIEENTYYTFIALFFFSVIVFIVSRGIIAKGLVYLAKKTETIYDDIIVEELRPFRFAYIAPLLVFYLFAYLIPSIQNYIENISLFLILWVVVVTVNSLISALNKVYESTPSFTGVSIQGYLDIVKMIIILIGLILSVSLITGESPLTLLSGLGALTAILLLIFRDTILSLVASIQISSNELIKEGDWIEVPSYNADGDVIDMSLHTIKIQNFDKTISIIPTHKMIEVSYKNWRGMQESGGRRIKRSIHIDISSIKFCDSEMVDRFSKINLINDYLKEKVNSIEKYKNSPVNTQELINDRQLTNIGTFRAYMQAYIKNQESIHKKDMTFLVRQLAPGRTGVPIEVYVFTKTTLWNEYENIQADIFDHLLAAVSYFDLKVFQEPTAYLIST